MESIGGAIERVRVGRHSDGNAARVIFDGDEAFEQARSAIEHAERRVWVEVYTLEPDFVGIEAMRALRAAAARGCDTALLFDHWGSYRLSSEDADMLRDEGIQVGMFNPIWSARGLGRKIASVLHRDHRKLVVVDDEAFCGGRNASLDYGGPGPERFSDVTVRLRGPVVDDLAYVYQQAFYMSTGRSLEVMPCGKTAGDAAVTVARLDNRNGVDELDVVTRELIKEASDYCFIVTPYLVPPEWFIEAVAERASSGVDVRIVTAGSSDVPIARTAGRHIYRRLVRAGVRIFELSHPVLHSKFVTMDGVKGMVGSYNFDRYGGRYNLELGVVIESDAVAKALQRAMFDYQADSTEFTPERCARRGIVERCASGLLYYLSGI